ncbi:hypothetical protein JCM19237_5688 [Photobacterium aphoticum]|uniref:Uncharacterized protein n=1 Tax=Photobacterium aphoticum TaxID=754436 RepID=A0A090QI17_9GAMM|nr:hypothetical protein JCM19237_5688 [Photobacterium aphoticum]
MHGNVVERFFWEISKRRILTDKVKNFELLSFHECIRMIQAFY